MKYYFDDYVIFDIETTGLDCFTDKIIEIGAIKVKNNEIVEEFNYLINPNIILPEVIVNITGITDEDLKDKETIDKILPKFIEFVEDYPLLAHNNSFDLGFINENIKKLNLNKLNNTMVDTLELSRKYLTHMYNHKLETLKKYYGINEVSHRAVGDCKTTNYVYQEIKKKMTVIN
ncbi:MAG: 3'-5' exonuclease [Bacilli bacterium]|nr:3'-5' exonuclease [Bacilli bacterium]